MDLSEKKVFEKFKAKRSNGDVVRCMREENGTVFVFGKRKTRYGTRYTDEQFENYYVIIEGADPAIHCKLSYVQCFGGGFYGESEICEGLCIGEYTMPEPSKEVVAIADALEKKLHEDLRS